ncbi:lamin tail domain-containing protein [Streptomyces sp. NBC_00820]|uniref:lamin tail domain-containing protein n=1 Tax=Streptomyces sp. NBC_00820 TaxID=2975842 RepID=UPI002ED2EA31|nr:lamin tail domain-containing protein [Streptomyces sp. NBC_00820]
MTVSTTARRLTAAALTTAAITAAIAVPASAADHGRSHQPIVRISDVQHESGFRGPHSNRALNSEWVEISNNFRRSVNLDGWTLSDRAGHTYTFDHYRLGGRSTVRVHTGIGHDSRHDLYQDRRNSVWDQRDTATLRDDHRRVVDITSWGNGRRDGGDHRRDGRH